jgi:two-component system, OmpR family, phosphate regulon sensor histidine kinase PhoR
MSSRDMSAFGYRRIVILLVLTVVVPTALLLAVGAVLLFLGEAKVNLLLGILVIALAGLAVTGVSLVWVFVRREANLSRLQSDFVSKVSHELRTPLTSIRLFSETLALRRGDMAAEDKCIEGLTKESARLQELIDRLLDWGRMESGRREFVFRTTDVQAIVDAALAAFEPIRERRRVVVELEKPPENVSIQADRAAMADALFNLLTNAYKYGGDPPVINLSVEVQPDEVRIGVHDNGSGIPPVEHKRIFQKFYRLDDRLSRDREGSGLGLAIVKHVMKAHRGHVRLVSEPGKGSTFTLVLPRKASKRLRSESDGATPDAGRGANATTREFGHG